MRIYHALLGYEELAISARHAACFLSLCRSTGWAYQPLAPSDGEWMTVRCTLAVASHLRPACAGRGITIRTVARGGLPAVLMRYRYRVGIVIGLLLAVLVLWAGSGVLWDIRVRGNVTLSEEAVVGQLAAAGLTVGCPLGEKIDTREIENRLLRASPDIAWISVNIRGTVAEVQIREIQKEQSAVQTDKVNLVAAMD